jgi:carbamoyltransferase
LKEFDDTVTITKAYEAVTNYLGFHFIEAGKTMGLSSYGQKDENIPPFFINSKGNKNLLRPQYPAGAFIEEYRFPYLTRNTNPQNWHKEPSMIEKKYENLAWQIQQESQELVGDLIQKAADSTGETNIVLSGGYALNCVANYYYKKRFPNLNIYVDPISHDGGSAIGLALLVWHLRSGDTTPNALKTVYLHTTPDYNDVETLIQNNKELKIKDVNYSDIVELLTEQKIVSLFQGRAEGGPRALGNRSILFDPRVQDGKDIVNQVKGREWFRPFAGSVLVEQSNEWFDMAGLKESPFMMYAVDVLPEKRKEIPSITHADGTCRVQTVSKENNEHYYNLISAFFEKTGVPILFNTSFNLAGDPLVETVEDAINTLLKSKIQYLYMPEIGKLIYKS